MFVYALAVVVVGPDPNGALDAVLEPLLQAGRHGEVFRVRGKAAVPGDDGFP